MKTKLDLTHSLEVIAEMGQVLSARVDYLADIVTLEQVSQRAEIDPGWVDRRDLARDVYLDEVEGRSIARAELTAPAGLAFVTTGPRRGSIPPKPS